MACPTRSRPGRAPAKRHSCGAALAAGGAVQKRRAAAAADEKVAAEAGGQQPSSPASPTASCIAVCPPVPFRSSRCRRSAGPPRSVLPVGAATALAEAPRWTHPPRRRTHGARVAESAESGSHKISVTELVQGSIWATSDGRRRRHQTTTPGPRRPPPVNARNCAARGALHPQRRDRCPIGAACPPKAPPLPPRHGGGRGRSAANALTTTFGGGAARVAACSSRNASAAASRSPGARAAKALLPAKAAATAERAASPTP